MKSPHKEIYIDNKTTGKTGIMGIEIKIKKENCPLCNGSEFYGIMKKCICKY